MFTEKIQFHIGDNPELSELVQRKLFDMGHPWTYDDHDVDCTDKPYLFVDSDQRISWSSAPTPQTGYRSIDPYEFISDYLTLKPISYEGCSKVIAHFLKKGMAIECIKERVTMVSNYAKDVAFPHRGKPFTLEVGAKPTFKKPTTTHVKKASEIIAWCERNGRWDGRHWMMKTFAWSVDEICNIAGKSDTEGIPKEWLEER